jgi:hypothetical protein
VCLRIGYCLRKAENCLRILKFCLGGERVYAPIL